MTATLALASTLGMESQRELSEYRYQRYTSPAVYAVGEQYFCVCKNAPSHKVGGAWQKHKDQFFAERAGSVIWVSQAE